MIRTGTKVYRYEGESRIVKRVHSVNIDSKEYVIIDEVTKVKEKVPIAKFEDIWVALLPDMLISFMITKDKDGNNDVYAVGYRVDEIMKQPISEVNKPVLILRQDTYSYTKNNLASPMAVTYVGDCVTSEFYPGDEIVSVFDFESIEVNETVACYVTDTIDDILRYLSRSTKDKINNKLKAISNRGNTVGIKVEGYCNTIKELMEDNDFLAKYRSIFGINQMDLLLVGTTDSDGNIRLTPKEQKAIEDLLRKHIKDVTVIAYDHDLDISSIVQYKHIMISDKSGKIYLVAYTEDGDYPVDDDIAKAFGLVQ